MIETSFNLFDVGVLGVIGLSALFSFFRGFVRELLSLGAWVGAAIITLYAFPHAAKLLEPHVKSTMIASGFAAMGTFMLALLLISILTSMMMKVMKSGSDIGLFDNALGLVFGLARGVLLVAVGFLGFSIAVPEDQYPDYVQTAMTRDFVEKSARTLAKIAPSYMDEMIAFGTKEDEDAPKNDASDSKSGDINEEDAEDAMQRLERMLKEKAQEE